MFTPSQVHRVAHCLVSEAYPHIQRETGYSAAGTAAHRFLARVRELLSVDPAHPPDPAARPTTVAAARELALREVDEPEHLAVLEALPLDHPRMPSLDPSAYTAELALALNLDTGEGRVLGKGLTRERARAAARPGELVGITDLAAQAGGRGVVFDLKFGHGVVPRAAVNLQTDTYGLMLCRAQGLDEAVQGIVRVFGEDEVWVDVVERDSLELDDHLERLRALSRQVEEVRILPPGERPQPVEGPWCTYCPAFLFCPAKRALLYAMVHDPEGTLPAPTDGAADTQLEPAALGTAWLKLKRAKQVMERVEAIFKELARIQPIPLEGGKVLGEVVTEGEGLIGWLAARVLEEKIPVVGRAVADAARCEMTGASLERALKAHLMPTLPRKPNGRPQPYAPVERDIWKLLAENHATRVTQLRRIVEFTPKESGK